MVMFKFLSKIVNDMGSGKKVACFGKLTYHNEFIKINIILPEYVKLDRWVQNGVAHIYRLGKNYLYEGNNIKPLQYFVLTGYKECKALIGIMKNSIDKSGRYYPLLVVASINDVDTCAGDYLFSHRYLFIEMEDLMISTKNDMAFTEFETKVNSLNISKDNIDDKMVFESSKDYLRNTRVSDLVKLVLPGVDEVGVTKFFSFLNECLLTVSKRKEERVDWGIRLPLSWNNNYLITSFWIEFCMKIINDNEININYTWVTESDIPYVNIFFSDISASSFCSFFSYDLFDELLVDVLLESQGCDAIKNIYPYEGSLDNFINYHVSGHCFQEVFNESS